ncbi:hypothetical protein [Trichoplusia ni ascovirus 2c]|uniref:hypothetical protein n=1 Tax=Trichoplusia ni ascovirus 2c TaxID=328615 RepID=UPI0000E4424B|nr:hypothetical protein TNAV2c_gp115 [Trichoplusia ni ascovirus 2c]ABF70632.1 hypothetical protein [Trichoplusia ni ascovirus 2c]
MNEVNSPSSYQGVSFDIKKVIANVLLCLSDPNLILSDLVKNLININPQGCMKLSSSPLRRDKTIGDGSNANIDIMKVENKDIIISHVTTDNAGHSSYERIPVIFKMPKKYMNINRIVFDTTSIDGIGIVRLPDPMSELFFTTLATYLYNQGSCPFLPRLLGAYSCIEKNNLQYLHMVYKRYPTTLGDILLKNDRKILNPANIRAKLSPIMIQVFHALHAMKRNFGFVHFDLHLFNVLVDYVGDVNTKDQYYNGYELKSRRYFVLDMYTNIGESKSPVFVILPITNSYMVSINDFGLGCILLEAGRNRMLTHNYIFSSAKSDLNEVYGGSGVLPMVITNKTALNTMDVCFILSDMWRLLNYKPLNKSREQIALAELVNNISLSMIGVRMSDLFELDPSLNNIDRKRNITVPESSIFHTCDYMLNGMIDMCDRTRRNVLLNFPKQGRVHKNATIYYVR